MQALLYLSYRVRVGKIVVATAIFMVVRIAFVIRIVMVMVIVIIIVETLGSYNLLSLNLLSRQATAHGWYTTAGSATARKCLEEGFQVAGHLCCEK